MIDGARVGVLAQVPDVFQDALPRHDPSFPLNQVAQQVGFHQRERVDAVAHPDLLGFEVDGPPGEGEPVRWRRVGLCAGLVPQAASQQGVHARDEDRQVERFRQIVVGSGGKALQDVLGAPPRRQHEDRDEVTALAQGRGDLEAVDARQHDVEDDGVERRSAGFDDVERRFAGFDVVSFRLEVEPQSRRDVRFVFDNEQRSHDAAVDQTTPGRASGSSKWNVAPRPGPGLVAHARPPWRRAAVCTMNRPSPVPLTRWVTGPGTR